MEQTILKQKIKELPSEYTRAISQINLPLKLSEIATAEKLHIDQLSELEIESMMSLLGLRSPEEFFEKIQEKLGIDENQAISITDAVNTEIFLPIREFIQNNTTAEEKPSVHLETPDEILKHIEDGGLELPAPEIAPEPTPTPDLTEHLLQNTVASPHVEETKVEKKYTVDPYREPIA